MRRGNQTRAGERARIARLSRLGLIFGVGLLAVTAVLLFKSNPFPETRIVKARFDESASLGKILRTVRVNGVNVGHIDAVRRVGDDAEFDLALTDEAGVIHEDASAELRPHIIFEGTVFVDLDPGSSDAPAVGAAGIPKSRTSVFVPFDVGLRPIDERRRERIRQTANEFSTGFGGKAIEGFQKTLEGSPPLVKDLASASRATRGGTATELREGLPRLAATISAVASENTRIAGLVSDSRRTFEAVGVDSQAPLDQTLRELAPTAVEVDLGSAALETVLDRVDPLAADLEPALDELTPTLRDARPLLSRARPVLRRATPLIRDLREAVRRTSAAAPETEALLTALEPSLDILEGSTLPYLHEDNGLGLPNYMQLAAFTSGAAGAPRPYQTLEQNPLGGGRVALIEANQLEPIDGPPAPCSLLGEISAELRGALEDAGVCSP